MAEPAFKIPLGSLILPAALFISSACVLFLTIQSASLATLRSENERESSRQAELAGSLKALRGQLEPAKLELANTAAELARLSEEQKSARDLISRASALSRSVEQFTAEESAAIRRLEETRKLQKESADRVDAARGELAAVGAQIRQLDANRREAETKLSDVTAKETAAAQRLQDRERTVAARERTLAEKERLVAEKDAEAASLSASVKRLDAEKRQLDTDIAARRSEAASLIVTDIDEIVKQVRFDGWQTTAQGEREVKQALRRALLKFKLHTDQDLFDRSYGYIRQYY